MSTDWCDWNELGVDEAASCVEVILAPGFPLVRHPAQADVFARHEGVPGHDQQALTDARILMIGAGGLGSWVGVTLARSGAGNLTIIDGDRFDRTNASRQLMFGGDIGAWKAHALARNLAPHMVAGGYMTAIAAPFEEAQNSYALAANLLIVLVDNNACRLQALRLARERQIPAVFSMLSLDGMRVHTFLQGPAPQDACLWCAAPNLDPDAVAPCAASVVTSCFVSAAQVTFFAHRALMGWPDGYDRYNWRTADLFGVEPEQVASVLRRAECAVCG